MESGFALGVHCASCSLHRRSRSSTDKEACSEKKKFFLWVKTLASKPSSSEVDAEASIDATCHNVGMGRYEVEMQGSFSTRQMERQRGLLYYSWSRVKISAGMEIRKDIKAGFKGAVECEYHGLEL